MRAYLLKLSSILFSNVSCNDPARGDELDLYVLAGQSNMYGHQGNANEYPKDPENLDGTIKFYKAGKWVALQPQKGRFPKGHFGPEVTFARELARSGRKVAIFKYSAGSTSLAGDWKAPNSAGMYDRMIKELKKAVKQLEKDGWAPTYRAFIWIQGESDAETKPMADGYEARLRVLTDHFRVKVSLDIKLPFILGVDEQHPWVKTNPQVVGAQKRLAKEDENTVFTSMKGLEKADSSHLSPSGLVEHGLRLCAAYNTLISKDDP